MQKLRVESFTVSIDGFGAGPDQSLENPMGVGGSGLHQWAFPTKTFQLMFGKEDGTTGIDNDFSERGFSNIGAWILGRNMFAHSRGPWQDDNWKGWWGDNPPYHVPVFVFTHYKRDPIEMEGGTNFYFVDDDIKEVLERAFDAADGKDVRLGGGVNTIKQYLNAQLIDEMHIAVSPIILGSGENLFAGINLPDLGYRCVEQVNTEKAMHIIIKKDS